MLPDKISDIIVNGSPSKYPNTHSFCRYTSYKCFTFCFLTLLDVRKREFTHICMTGFKIVAYTLLTYLLMDKL